MGSTLLITTIVCACCYRMRWTVPSGIYLICGYTHPGGADQKIRRLTLDRTYSLYVTYKWPWWAFLLKTNETKSSESGTALFIHHHQRTCFGTHLLCPNPSSWQCFLFSSFTHVRTLVVSKHVIFFNWFFCFPLSLPHSTQMGFCFVCARMGVLLLDAQDRPLLPARLCVCGVCGGGVYMYFLSRQRRLAKPLIWVIRQFKHQT